MFSQNRVGAHGVVVFRRESKWPWSDKLEDDYEIEAIEVGRVNRHVKHQEFLDVWKQSGPHCSKAIVGEDAVFYVPDLGEIARRLGYAVSDMTAKKRRTGEKQYWVIRIDRRYSFRINVFDLWD